MQPEPTKLTQTTSQNSTQDASTSNQHGLHHHHEPIASGPQREGRAIDNLPLERGAGALESEQRQGLEQSPAGRDRRLSSTSSKRTGSPVDRIIEHEEAVISSPKKKKEGPAFTIVRRKSNGNPRLNLTDFPNGKNFSIGIVSHLKSDNLTIEVLTHVLSHLPPSTLSEVSLVSHRFHNLVTSPHAWRIAFSRHFPAQEALNVFDQGLTSPEKDSDTFRSERRVFTRLTALASWRSEYILRTRLIRSLGRGKPASIQETAGAVPSRSGSSQVGNAQITYNSNLITTVNHLHATFRTSLNKRSPNFIHGADEVGSACLSDPRTGKVDHWGFADPQMFTHAQDEMPGVPHFGLGPGEVACVPNTMDVSRLHGMVYAEGIPGGKMYYRSTEERRGRLLVGSLPRSWPELGIPHFLTGPIDGQTPCSLWIAKTKHVPGCSEGLIGILSGSSRGIMSSYSVGTSGLDERRIERGEVTCRWVLSPGVPIIAISVDENVSTKRLASRRIWAVALNALGEIYYLTDMPTRPHIERKTRLNETHLEQLAWETGRTVHWSIADLSRRVARPDPFNSSKIDGSYSPRSSWNGMGLGPEQIAAETTEIQEFLAMKPKDFRNKNEGWDMQRRLEVDFASDDGSKAGEHAVVIQFGLEEEQVASIKRYTRCRVPNPGKDSSAEDDALTSSLDDQPAKKISIFGLDRSNHTQEPGWSFESIRRSSTARSDCLEEDDTVEEWRMSTLSWGALKAPQITTTAIDLSNYASLTVMEDPLLCMGGSSISSSPMSSPLPQMPRPNNPSDVPGQRARLLAVGTKSGTVILWNMRDPISTNSAIVTTIQPVRIIHTDSPQISCLALSALYLVHGGNDGLVQAWDPLASTTEPIRTLNSRFSSRARRRLIQAEASPQGVGINLFAAGAIFLDPDPTVLRGIVSLGTHLRYWSYSSSAADQYKTSKRRLRRSERGSNQGADKFTGTGRGALKDYIANEKLELEREKTRKRKEQERLAGRFGLGLLGPGATEDEILAYATLLSEESAASDEQRRKSGSSSSSGSSSPSSMETIVEDRPLNSATEPMDEITDPEIAEAIRLSLEASDSTGYAPAAAAEASFPIRVRKARRGPSLSPPRKVIPGPSEKGEQEDLEFAMRLSLVEEESRMEG
ncbi:MAG: hypothetical protein Q9222_007174, partial [Ikaeria aurantiellina]